MVEPGQHFHTLVVLTTEFCMATQCLPPPDGAHELDAHDNCVGSLGHQGSGMVLRADDRADDHARDEDTAVWAWSLQAFFQDL